MKTINDGEAIFGRRTEDGNVAILFAADGLAVTRMQRGDYPGGIWPVGSDLGCGYEHPNGIILTEDDARKLGVEIED